MIEQPFALSNAPPKREPWCGDQMPAQAQRPLFGGLDCLSGQQDLFETDGSASEPKQDLGAEP